MAQKQLQRVIEAVKAISERGKKLTQVQIAKDLGYQRYGTISDIFGGRTAMTPQFIRQFAKNYGVNEAWLNTGKGKMFVPEDKNNTLQSPLTKPQHIESEKNTDIRPNNPRTHINGKTVGRSYNGPEDEDSHTSPSGNQFISLGNGQFVMLTPLVEEQAQAGYLSGFRDASYLEELPKHPHIVNSMHRGLYLSIEVAGDSMNNGVPEDSICNGDIVTGRVIDQKYWNSRLHLHKFKNYIVVFHDEKDEGIVVKRIAKHDLETQTITCHSLNPDKDSYPDFELHLKDVLQIMNVVNVSRNMK